MAADFERLAPIGKPWKLVVSNLHKAEGFYGSVFDWRFDELSFPGYTTTDVDEEGRGGGLMERPPEASGCARNVYVGVNDVEGALAKAQAGGAKVLIGKTDIPGIGSWVCSSTPTASRCASSSRLRGGRNGGGGRPGSHPDMQAWLYALNLPPSRPSGASRHVQRSRDAGACSYCEQFGKSGQSDPDACRERGPGIAKTLLPDRGTRLAKGTAAVGSAPVDCRPTTL